MVHGVNGGLGHCGEQARLLDTGAIDALGRTRHDAAIMNKQVALWLIMTTERFQGRFAFSEKAIDSVGYRIMFTTVRDCAPFVRSFNRELSRMKQNGTLDRIMASYQARE